MGGGCSQLRISNQDEVDTLYDKALHDYSDPTSVKSFEVDMSPFSRTSDHVSFWHALKDNLKTSFTSVDKFELVLNSSLPDPDAVYDMEGPSILLDTFKGQLVELAVCMYGVQIDNFVNFDSFCSTVGNLEMLKTFKFYNRHLLPDTGISFCNKIDALMAAVGTLESIQELELNYLSANIRLPAPPNAKKVHINTSCVSNESLRSMLHHCVHLKTLRITKCDLVSSSLDDGDKGQRSSEVCAMLSSHASLEWLEIERCSFMDVSQTLQAPMLKSLAYEGQLTKIPSENISRTLRLGASNLEELSLSLETPLPGWQSLIDAAVDSSKLQSLTLHCTSFPQYEGLIEGVLREASGKGFLRSLSMGHCHSRRLLRNVADVLKIIESNYDFHYLSIPHMGNPTDDYDKFGGTGNLTNDYIQVLGKMNQWGRDYMKKENTRSKAVAFLDEFCSQRSACLPPVASPCGGFGYPAPEQLATRQREENLTLFANAFATQQRNEYLTLQREENITLSCVFVHLRENACTFFEDTG